MIHLPEQFQGSILQPDTPWEYLPTILHFYLPVSCWRSGLAYHTNGRITHTTCCLDI